jgi:hypothetical protein
MLLITNMGTALPTLQESRPRDYQVRKEGRVTTVFNNIHKFTTIFFPEDIDSLHYEDVYWLPSGSSFNYPEEREKSSRHKDFIRDRISHGQLMKGDFRNIFWAENMKHLKVLEGMEKCQIWYAKL